jgi:hypothetical protein
MTYVYTGLGHGRWASQLNVSDGDLAAAGRRLKTDNMQMLALRFEEDRICPRARIDRLREAFGDNLEVEELGGASTLQRIFSPRHSTLTPAYDKARGLDRPEQQAFGRVVAFLRARLPTET